MSITSILFLSNALSARMAHAALELDGVSSEECAVFTGRRFASPWLGEVGLLEPYPSAPAFTLAGQHRFVQYYARSARVLRNLLEFQSIRRIYLSNSDNLLSAHMLAWAAEHPEVDVTVLVEGLMNFQDITLRNRAAWRGRTKAVMSRLLGLTWTAPETHLSGAFEPVVARVLSFSGVGLQAPEEKVRIVRFDPVEARTVPNPNGAIIAQTGLWQWMNDDDRRVFADRFVDWVHAQGFDPLFVKPHPNYDTSFLERRLPRHERIGEGRILEDMAAELPAATVVSTNCTALVTLRMLRPDIRCIDYGWDFYCPRAYFGDTGVVRLLHSADVETVAAGLPQ